MGTVEEAGAWPLSTPLRVFVEVCMWICRRTHQHFYAHQRQTVCTPGHMRGHCLMHCCLSLSSGLLQDSQEIAQVCQVQYAKVHLPRMAYILVL